MKLAMTVTVKAMDSQRWICRIHLFQSNGTSSEDELEADRARCRDTTLDRNGASTLDPLQRPEVMPLSVRSPRDRACWVDRSLTLLIPGRSPTSPPAGARRSMRAPRAR